MRRVVTTLDRPGNIVGREILLWLWEDGQVFRVMKDTGTPEPSLYYPNDITNEIAEGRMRELKDDE